MDSKLMDLDATKVDDVPLKGIWTPARVVKVIDGDTLCVVILIGDYPLKLSVRVNGIDCPESVKGRAKSTDEMMAGKRVTEYVRRITTNIVRVRLTAKDKYCRFLGDIEIDGIGSLSCHLLEKGYCKSYGGAKKGEWTESELKVMLM